MAAKKGGLPWGHEYPDVLQTRPEAGLKQVGREAQQNAPSTGNWVQLRTHSLKGDFLLQVGRHRAALSQALLLHTGSLKHPFFSEAHSLDISLRGKR